MAQPHTEWEKDVKIDPAHLTEDEVVHECTLRNTYLPGFAPEVLRMQLAITFAKEQADETDTVEAFRVPADSETVQAEFEALIAITNPRVDEFLSALMDANVAPAVVLSRMKHYLLRLLRFPTELYNSTESMTIVRQFEKFAGVADRLQRANSVVNDIIDQMPPASHNSTAIQPDSTPPPPPVTSNVTGVSTSQAQTTTANSVADQSAQSHFTVETLASHGEPLERGRDPTDIQTSESFRASSQFNTLAQQPTPPCYRGVPLSVQFQLPPEQEAVYVPAGGRSPTEFSFGHIPHSTRMTPAVRTGHETHQPNRQHSAIGRGVTNDPQLANTIRLLPSETDNTRTFSDSYIRQAGSELQALKRWLGAKTFEGETVDAKHFSIDEFLSHLQLCLGSGICSEQTMLRNLAPAFTGRAFKWWTTTHGQIQTFAQLIQAIKVRFATYAGSVEGLMSAIYGRRQQKHESLPDFVDSMQQLMDQIPDRFSTAQRISTIISCAVPDDARLLRSRGYVDMMDFTRHVAFISQDRPKHTHERHEKKSNRDKSVFSCEVKRDDSEASTEDEEENTSIDIQAIATALQKAGFNLKRQSKQVNPKMSKQQSSNTTKSGSKSHTSSEVNEQKAKFQCFGCGAPEVYYANCKVCQTKDTNDKPKREVYCFGCGAANVYYTSCESCQAKLSKNDRTASA